MIIVWYERNIISFILTKKNNGIFAYANKEIPALPVLTQSGADRKDGYNL